LENKRPKRNKINKRKNFYDFEGRMGKRVSTYVLWGGEPLMVKDLGFYLKTAKILVTKQVCAQLVFFEGRFGRDKR